MSPCHHIQLNKCIYMSKMLCVQHTKNVYLDSAAKSEINTIIAIIITTTLILKATGIINKIFFFCGRLTWISRAWYIIIRPSNITVERLIRHFSANEYEDSCGERKKRKKNIRNVELKQLTNYNIQSYLIYSNKKTSCSFYSLSMRISHIFRVYI